MDERERLTSGMADGWREMLGSVDLLSREELEEPV